MTVNIKIFLPLFLLVINCSQHEIKNETASQPAKHKGQILVPLPPYLDELAFLD